MVKVKRLVQLVGLVEVTSKYFLTGFDSHETIVCKMGQTGHAKFIRLLKDVDVPIILPLSLPHILSELCDKQAS